MPLVAAVPRPREGPGGETQSNKQMLLVGAFVLKELEFVRGVTSGLRATLHCANRQLARSRFAARYAAPVGVC